MTHSITDARQRAVRAISRAEEERSFDLLGASDRVVRLLADVIHLCELQSRVTFGVLLKEAEELARLERLDGS